jgi:hypothetical protein
MEGMSGDVPDLMTFVAAFDGSLPYQAPPLPEEIRSSREYFSRP